MLNKLYNLLFPPGVSFKALAFGIYSGLVVGLAFLLRWWVGGAASVVALPWALDTVFSVVILAGLAFFVYVAFRGVKK